MPAGRGNSQNIYIGRASSIESVNMNPDDPDARIGELGQIVYTTGNKGFQRVAIDSGVTAATPVGVLARGDLLFWKNKSSYLVTNDIRVALGSEDATKDNKRMNVAGVASYATTAGYNTYMQISGNMPAVASDGGGDFQVGEFVVAGDNTNATIDRVAGATAPGWTTVGTVAAVESGGFTSVDLNLPNVP